MGISKDLIEFLELEPYDYPYEPDDESYDEYDGYEYKGYFTENKCPTCKRSYNIIHFECGEYIDKCTCPKDEADTVYYCSPCDIIWDTSTDEVMDNFSSEMESQQDSLFDDVSPYLSEDPYSPQMQAILNDEKLPVEKGKWGVYHNNTKTSGVVTTTKNTTTYNYKTCKHKHDEVKLFDGTPIYCSSVRDKSAEKVPDFGLYADFSWHPLWRNEFITWPDYGIPTDEELGLTQIYEAYCRAIEGEMVEIGCIGGHGRTGTILAIMYIASAEGQVTGKEAFDFVKKNYCEHAIESDIQEWYINYASAFWYGTELPDKPIAATTTTNWCNITDHYAMMLRGHQKCATKGKQCNYWGQDLNSFNKKDKVANDYNNFYTALSKAKDYDYVFGGLVRYVDDAETNGCSPLDHYIMITTGHEGCIRLPGECTFWDKDVEEWLSNGTINNISDWSDEGESGEFMRKIYPTVEEWKVLQEIQAIHPPEVILLGREEISLEENKTEGKSK
jgi:protein-tyrosine phosphatase